MRVYQFVLENQAVFSVTAMCRVLQASRRAYYKWRENSRSERQVEDERLMRRIRAIHADSGGRYGVRRVAAMLRREFPGLGLRRVQRLMRACGLAGRSWRRKMTTTVPGGRCAPEDRVSRDFNRERLDELWVADSTYIRVKEGFGYLAVVMDACSRRIIGRSFSRSHDTELMLGALQQAVSYRQADGVVHHSDRGVQYLSDSYRSRCEQHGIEQSVGRIGNSYDNAAAESVFATLKRELPVNGVLESFEGMRTKLYDYIDRFYNVERLHSRLGNLSPIEFEENLLKNFSSGHAPN